MGRLTSALIALALALVSMLACNEDKNVSESSARPEPSELEDKPLEPNVEIPKVGSRVTADGSEWIVVGAGHTSFEYTVGEKAVAIAVAQGPVLGVLQQDKGAKIRVDPREPMLYVNGEKHRFFTQQKAVRDAAHNKVLMLLELP